LGNSIVGFEVLPGGGSGGFSAEGFSPLIEPVAGLAGMVGGIRGGPFGGIGEGMIGT
jgi:hypothetical protein